MSHPLRSIHKFRPCRRHFPCRHAPQQLFEGLALLREDGLEAHRGLCLASTSSYVEDVRQSLIYK
jgi:hypothetical protein